MLGGGLLYSSTPKTIVKTNTPLSPKPINVSSVLFDSSPNLFLLNFDIMGALGVPLEWCTSLQKDTFLLSFWAL